MTGLRSCALTLGLAGFIALAISASAPGAEAIEILEITTWAGNAGATVVEVRADGPIPPTSFSHAHVSGQSPREILRISGVTSPYPTQRHPVDDDNVLQIRIGHHPETDPPELHLVLDLTSNDVVVTRLVRDGSRLRMELAPSTRDEQPAAPAGPPAAPTAGAEAPVPTPGPPSGVVPDKPLLESRRDALEPLEGPALVRVTAQPGDTGSTVVTVTCDHQLEPYSVRELQLAGLPPRYILSIAGFHRGRVPEEIRVEDSNLRRILLVERRETDPPAVHVVMELDSPAVVVDHVERRGSDLVVRLRREANPETSAR